MEEMKSRKNKGYTLVELLVAMVILVIMLMELYSVMANSSTIYRKGGYEVQLQSEAQQVIQQIEDIMVDCNGSISYNATSQILTVSSNVMDPSTNTATPIVYTIRYVAANVPPVAGAPASPFGTLRYQKTGMTSEIPLADYVESFDVDMSGYGNDNVTLNIKLANEDNAYSATKDVYLRNEIGSGGGGDSQNTSGAKKFLDVKRYQDYDLSEMYDTIKDGYKYDYKDFYFLDEHGNKKYETKEYNIDSSTYELTIKSSYRNDKAKEYGPYMIYATGTVTKPDGTVEDITDTNPLLISAHTDKVSFGFSDYSYFYLPGAEPSYKATGLTSFRGIYLGGAEKVTYTYVLEAKSGYHQINESEGTVKHTLCSATKKASDTGSGIPSSQGESSTVKYYYQSENINKDWKFNEDGHTTEYEYQCQLPTLYNYIDTTSNAVVTYNGNAVWNPDRCAEFISYRSDGTTPGFLMSGHKFYIYVSVQWDSPSCEEHFKIYLYPTNRVLSTEEKTRLEDQSK